MIAPFLSHIPIRLSITLILLTAAVINQLAQTEAPIQITPDHELSADHLSQPVPDSITHPQAIDSVVDV